MVRTSTLLLALTLLAPVAHAEGWDASFPPAELKGYFTPGEVVMVVRAGPPSDELTAAATALIEGLRGAGAKPLDDSTLGDVSTSSDAAIVPLAAKNGASSVAIVRLGAGAQDVASVTFYGKEGAPRGTVSGSRAAEPAQPAPQQPETPAAPPQPSPDAARAQAAARFEDELVGFGETTQQTWNGPQQVMGPYQGRAHRPLSMPEFFDLVGRHDLSESFRSRESRRDTLITGGAVVMIASLVAAAVIIAGAPAQGSCDPGSPDFQACSADVNHSQQVHYTSGVLVGVLGTAVGAGVAGAGYLTDPMPVSEAEAMDLAKQHDEKLKKDLGLGALQLRPSIGPGRVSLAVKF